VDNQNPAYLIFMMILSIFAIVGLGIEAVWGHIDPATARIIDYADMVICGFFFADFIYLLCKAEDRKRYFFTWGWLDLASSIPMIDAFRLGRIGRIMRIFRVLRGVRAARILTVLILEKRAQSVFLAAALVSVILVAVAAISALHFEAFAEGSTIKTAEDAVWWAVVTISTVGYGDKYPVTAEGRMVATVLMVAGVGLFGVFSGFVASWFLAPTAHKQDDSLALLNKEVAKLRHLLEGHITEKPGDGEKSK
jgi:voltage-gated potassium channel